MARKLSILTLVIGIAIVFSFSFAGAQMMKYQEAPMLAEMVKAGSLPPVAERLPKNPLVWGSSPDVAEQEEDPKLARYGGTLKVAHERFLWNVDTIGFARPGALIDGSMYPDVAEKLDFSSDFKTLTIHMREGMKWSDGMPFTADDIMFWWNDLFLSKHGEYSGWVSRILDKEKDTLTKVDDYTLRFQFAEPKPNFITQSRGLAGGESGAMFTAKHWASQYHPDYNPKADVSKEEQFNDLLDIVSTSVDRYIQYVDRPTLAAWKVVGFEEGQFYRLERNPYFFAVDRLGRQLPYIDFVESSWLKQGQAELIKLKTLAGESDWDTRVFGGNDVPVLLEKGPAVGIEVLMHKLDSSSFNPIVLNWKHPDPDVKAMFKNVKFRRALSVAIDRNLVNETVHLGLGQPGQGYSFPGEGVVKDIDDKWIDFDPGLANRLLDEVGMDKRDSEGFRLLPGGKEFNLVLAHRKGWRPGSVPLAEISAENWRAVGLRIRAEEQGLAMYDKWRARTYDLMIWAAGGAPLYYYGANPPYDFATWYPEEYEWYTTNGDKGVEPVSELKRIFDLDKVIRQNPYTSDEAKDAFVEFKNLAADLVLQIGAVQSVPHPTPTKMSLKNVWGRKSPKVGGDDESWFRSWYWENGVRE